MQVICVNHRDATRNDVTWRPLGSTPTVVESDQGVRLRRVGRRASVSRLDVCPGLLRTLWELREQRVDIVHVHAPNPTMFVALATLPPFSTLVVTHHSDVVKQRFLGRVFAPVERLVHDRTAMLLSDSEAYIAGSAVLKSRLAKVRALPLGLDLTHFTQPSPAALRAEETLRARSAGPMWLAVGRLVYYKGLTTAIDALRSVPGRLMIIGRGPIESDLRARAADRGVADRIEWAGQVEDAALVGAYRAATALWFPSNARSEGFGLVQVEAMASGCPVINTAIPHSGVSWVSPDGQTGFTIPVGDWQALAAASRRLLDEPGLRDRLSRQAIARAQLEFDDDVMARRSLAFYASAISATAAPPTSASRARPDAVIGEATATPSVRDGLQAS